MKSYRRVAIVEEFYPILKQIHDKDCLHAGSRKTYARVQSLYSYIPRVVVEKYKANHVVKVLHNYVFPVFGLPAIIHSDNGKEFGIFVPDVNFWGQLDEDVLKRPSEDVKKDKEEDDVGKEEVDEEKEEEDEEKEEEDEENEEEDEEKDEEDEEKEEEDEENEEEDEEKDEEDGGIGERRGGVKRRRGDEENEEEDEEKTRRMRRKRRG
eukprot:Em0007g941a